MSGFGAQHSALMASASLAGEDAARLGNLRLENFSILADLRMSPLDPNAAMVVQFLQRLNGLNTLLHPHAEFRKKSDSIFAEDHRPIVDPGLLNYFGEGLPVTKKRILDALSATLLKAADAAKARDSMLLLIYVSAHGLTGPDGLPYILPADTNAQDPGTWIAYDQILKPVYAFIEQQDRVPSAADRITPTAIVILDTCQDPGGLGLGGKRPEKAADLSRPGVVVVEGTAPGQYVWHWKATTTEEKTTDVEHELRLGFPLPPKGMPRGHFATSTSASMSILPVAAQGALKRMMDDGKSRPQGVSRLISAYDWLAATAQSAVVLQREIPEVQESGMRQNIQIQKQPSQPNFALFRIVGKNP